MSTHAIGGATSQVFLAASGPKAARAAMEAQTTSPPVPERSPVHSAEDMAHIYVGIAESSLEQMNRAINHYAHLTSDRFDQYIEQRRQLEGDEVAAALQKDRETQMQVSRRLMEAIDKGLRGQFDVSGAIYKHDPETDTYSMGEFTLSLDAGYFAVKIDSKTGPEISVEGGPFTRDFVRKYAVDAQQLPYRMRDQKLLDVMT
jgi:hypothetical protein